jgi:predicted nucleic acid-binding protein
MFGARKSPRYEQHKDDHIKVLSVTVLQNLFPSLALYASEKARLHKAGNLIPEFDLLIGTTAV